MPLGQLMAIAALLTSLSLAAPAAAQGKGARAIRPPRVDGPSKAVRGFQDPAFSRGKSDGYRRGVEDGRKGERYDPVRHPEYRRGDAGYAKAYGARDGYKTIYRDGFRQGYEEGYREGARDQR